MKCLNLILVSLCMLISACSNAPLVTPTAVLEPKPTQWVPPTPNPAETPSIRSSSTPTHDELEHALADRVHWESNALCEWEEAGQTSQAIYVWAYCQSVVNDSAVSAPAVIHIGSDGHVQSVDMPRDGTYYGPDVRVLFPPDIQQRIFAGDFDDTGLGVRLAARRAQLRSKVITPVPLTTGSPITTSPQPQPLPAATFLPLPSDSIARPVSEWTNRIAYFGDDGGLWLMKPDGSDRQLIHLPIDTGGAGYDRRFVWSPEGARIAFINGSDLLVADLSTGVTRLIYRSQTAQSGPEAILPAPAWSPDGTTLAFIDGHTLRLALLDTEHIQQIADDVWSKVWANDPGGNLAWTADGRFVLYLSGGAEFREYAWAGRDLP